jgi:hypothetical protein
MGDFVEGLYITNSSFVKSKFGIISSNTEAESGLQVSNCHINCIESGIKLYKIYDLNITGNLIFSYENKIAIDIDDTGYYTVTGNVFRSNSPSLSNETAIKVANAPNNENLGGIISGNSFHKYSTAVWIGSTSNYVTVGINSYRGCTDRVLNQGANNTIHNNQYILSEVVVMTGGSSEELITINVPNGVFLDKIVSASCFSADLANALYGVFEYTASTKTSVIFKIKSYTGANIPSGNVRYSVSITGE